MFKHILDLYKNGLCEIKNDEKELKEELSILRLKHNFFHCFSSRFVLPLFGGGSIGYIFNMKINNHHYIFIMAIGIITLLVQWIIVCAECICDEEMKFVEDELEKINSTIQPNPKKISVRNYSRNLVRRSNFGR